LRKGPWKLILAPDAKAGTPVQLYNLDSDIGESQNRADENPGIVAEMSALMEKLVTDGRSTPGSPRQNDVEVRRFPVVRARATGDQGRRQGSR
jgi:hypothetical protein